MQLSLNNSFIAEFEFITCHINKIEKKNLCIKNTISALETQNAIIRIVDKSHSGWGTVKDYLSEKVGVRFHDFRKFRATERRTTRKKKRNSRKLSHQCNSIYSSIPAAIFNHLFQNAFPTNYLNNNSTTVSISWLNPSSTCFTYW